MTQYIRGVAMQSGSQELPHSQCENQIIVMATELEEIERTPRWAARKLGVLSAVPAPSRMGPASLE